MNKLLKRMKSLIAQGYASKSDKEAIKKELEGLEEDEKEVLEDKASEVESLPEEKEGDENVEKMLKSLLADSKSEISNEVKSDLKANMDAWIKEQKDLMEKKAGLYAPENKSKADKRDIVNNKFKAQCEALVTGNDTKLKEMTTDATGSPYAGYTVDSELSAEIRHLITEYGVARREMTTVQLTKGSYKANNLVTDPTLFWVDEGVAIDSTHVVLGQETLTLEKLGAIVSITRELIEDGEIDLFGFVASRLAEGFAEAEDKAFFVGDGSSTYGEFTGLLESSSGNNYTMAVGSDSIQDLTADDLIGMVDATPSGALGNGKFLLHRSVMSIIRTLKDENDNYIYQPISASGPETIWGYPVIYSEVMPSTSDDASETPFVLFGDFKKACIFGYKGGISADMFDAGTVRNVADSADINLITTDRKAMRWIERIGYIAIIPKAVTRLVTGETSE
jgi:HK97 family phage major capsid protein